MKSQPHGKGQMQFADADSRQSYDGDFLESEMHGLGNLTFKNGDIYQGQFSKGLLNGQAIITFGEGSDFSSFDGSWGNGQPIEAGMLMFKNGSTFNATYDCVTINGSQGPCTLQKVEMNTEIAGSATDLFLHLAESLDETTTSAALDIESIATDSSDILETSDQRVFHYLSGDDGSVYLGEIFNNLRNGIGNLQFPVIDARLNYTGHFVMGQINGNGTMYWKNGDRYQGNWLNGQREGQGIIVYAEDNDLLSYSGSWKGDRMLGTGTLIWKNGDHYTGEVEDGLMSGKGSYYWMDGRVYEGHFTLGHRQGYGKMKFQENNTLGLESYEGQWKYDSATGLGKMMWQNGERHEGYFQNGLQDGPGVRFSAQNVVLKEGNWNKGEFVE